MRAPTPIGRSVGVALAATVLAGGCMDPGPPTPSPARVAWAAYPDTVRTGETFSFEFAGPLSDDSCSRLDTAGVAVTDSTLEVSARRSVFREAMCSEDRRSFYQVRALRIRRAGRYGVRTRDGGSLGTLVAVDSGRFSPMTTRGLGTLRAGGGCIFLGPGWAANQRPFSLRDLPEGLRRLAGTDTLVRVDGTLVGYSLCGGFGSRPSIRVDTAWATDRTGADWYSGPAGTLPAGTDTTTSRTADDRHRGEKP